MRRNDSKCNDVRDETVRQCVPGVGGNNRKSAAADSRESGGWYNNGWCQRSGESVDQIIGNAVECSQIPGRDATENFVGQHGDLEFYSLLNSQPM